MIKVKHPNGYEGVLYGKTCMAIYNPQGRECLHTGFRNIDTEQELYKQLEDMPRFMEMFGNREEDNG